MKLQRWKQWWKVLSKEGFTLAQFLSERQAREYMAHCGDYPASAEFNQFCVNDSRGWTVRRINQYP